MSEQQDYLMQAEFVWKADVVRRRDVLLNVGELLHQHILAKLTEKNALGPHEQDHCGVTRNNLVKEAAERLGVGSNKINHFIAGSQVVALLATDGIGDISFHQIIMFQWVICRGRGAHKRGRTCHHEYETWAIKPECTGAKELFSRVVKEKLTYKETWRLTTEMNPNASHWRGTGSGKKFITEREKLEEYAAERADEEVKESQRLRINVPTAIKVCAPRDAAQMLYQELLSNHDPIATAHHLANLLQGKQFEHDIRDLKRQKGAA